MKELSIRGRAMTGIDNTILHAGSPQPASPSGDRCGSLDGGSDAHSSPAIPFGGDVEDDGYVTISNGPPCGEGVK